MGCGASAAAESKLSTELLKAGGVTGVPRRAPSSTSGEVPLDQDVAVPFPGATGTEGVRVVVAVEERTATARIGFQPPTSAHQLPRRISLRSADSDTHNSSVSFIVVDSSGTSYPATKVSFTGAAPPVVLPAVLCAAAAGLDTAQQQPPVGQGMLLTSSSTIDSNTCYNILQPHTDDGGLNSADAATLTASLQGQHHTTSSSKLVPLTGQTSTMTRTTWDSSHSSDHCQGMAIDN